MSGKYVVLVTGGSGCLGQHIIKLLQTRAAYVDEIRIIDVVPFVKKLDYDDRVPVTSHVQDISDLQDTSAFSGVTSVFHLASVISVNNFPDYELMERVNVLVLQMTAIRMDYTECGRISTYMSYYSLMLRIITISIDGHYIECD